MVDQRIISYEDQQSWFRSLSPVASRYFIYSSNGIDVGSTYLTQIDLQNRICSAGIFCGNRDFLGHGVNVSALLWLYLHSFEDLGLARVSATVDRSNHRALRLNYAFGFETVGRDNAEYLQLELVASKFAQRRRHLISLAGSIRPSI
jgi:RimJ/RimL family protein N-acetyltransferase